MHIKITFKGKNAEDLSYLANKNPERMYEEEVSYGKARLFFPEYTSDKASLVLALELDPIDIVRKSNIKIKDLDQYVNDRPYVVSSLLCSLIPKLLRDAMKGIAKENAKALERTHNAEVLIPAIRVEKDLIEKIFVPLGYELKIKALFDNQSTDEGKFIDKNEVINLYEIVLSTKKKISHILNELYILIQVLDDRKHYYIAEEEVQKLIDKGEEWLSTHPYRELIIRRFLKNLKEYTRKAHELLEEETESPVKKDLEEDLESEIIVKGLPLHKQRLNILSEVIKEIGVESVIDLGCGEGKLIPELRNNFKLKNILLVDISLSNLRFAQKRIEGFVKNLRDEFAFKQGSALYFNEDYKKYEMILLSEVIEHVDLDNLPRLELNLLKLIKPKYLYISTPNRDYNKLFEKLKEGEMRNSDHRFEWSRQEFNNWCEKIKNEFNYSYKIGGIGQEDSTHGYPTQTVLFTRND